MEHKVIKKYGTPIAGIELNLISMEANASSVPLLYLRTLNDIDYYKEKVKIIVGSHG